MSVLINYAKLKPGWANFFKNECEQKYFIDILNNVSKEYDKKIIYPPKDLMFNAFYTTDLDDIKVVILGQDPYHGPNQANGLAFSVNPNITVPPSLRNIFKEVESNFDIPVNKQNGDLTRWSNQGVFLLNAVLSVEKGKPRSHQNLNWQRFTDKVITFISRQCSNIVFVLWGEFAKQKESLIKDASEHLILKSAHPSPFSATKFFGNKHFLLINEYLKEHDKETIDFQ